MNLARFIKSKGDKDLRKIFWRVYLCLFALLVIGNTMTGLWSDSIIYTYYHVLTAFHPRYYLIYCLHIAGGFINLINLIPLYLYVFRKPSALTYFWRIMFVLRIVFEFFGHDYEYKLIKSIFYSNFILAASTLAVYVLIFIPSYMAVFRYAFRQETIAKK